MIDISWPLGKRVRSDGVARASAAGTLARPVARGMELVMNEKFAKGTKDFNILIQKARASCAR